MKSTVSDNKEVSHKMDFLTILKHVVRFKEAPRTVPCRCADCCSGKRKHQGKTASRA